MVGDAGNHSISPPPHTGIIMNIIVGMKLLIESLSDLHDCDELKETYDLTNIELEGYIDFFAENKVQPFSTIFGSHDEHIEKRNN